MNTTVQSNLQNIDTNFASNPIYKSGFQQLERALDDLFLKELRCENSIFLKVDSHVTKKIAAFLSKMVTRPVAIGVCGETASGKSTIVLDSIETIDNFAQEFMLDSLITRINTDDYYYDRSKEVLAAGSFSNFVKNYDLDIPQAIELSLMKKHIQQLLNHQKVFLPKYDMSGTAKRFDEHTPAKPNPIIISEGVFTLVDEIKDVFDFRIYVEIADEVQKRRFYERAQQRGLGDSADGIYKNAKEKAQIHIKPCAQNADIILNGAVSRDKYKQFVGSFLLLVEEIYYNMTV